MWDDESEILLEYVDCDKELLQQMKDSIVNECSSFSEIMMYTSAMGLLFAGTLEPDETMFDAYCGFFVNGASDSETMRNQMAAAIEKARKKYQEWKDSQGSPQSAPI